MSTSEPQSIVHQVLRLGQSIKRKSKGRSRTSRARQGKNNSDWKGKGKESGEDSSVSTVHTTSYQDSKSISSRARTSHDLASLASTTDEVLCTIDGEGEDQEGHVDLLDEPSVPLHEFEDTEDYKTIEQHEFLEKYLDLEEEDQGFRENAKKPVGAGSGCCFVHMYVESSELSQAIDAQMKKLSTSLQSSSSYVRMDAEKSLYVAVKLDIKTHKPTVLALKDGQVINRFSQFLSKDCSELQPWTSTIELMSMFRR